MKLNSSLNNPRNKDILDKNTDKVIEIVAVICCGMFITLLVHSAVQITDKDTSISVTVQCRNTLCRYSFIQVTEVKKNNRTSTVPVLF